MMLPDIQKTQGNFERIPWVGVEDVKIPVSVYYPELGYVKSHSQLLAYCSLSSKFRGIHMSRLMEVVYDCFMQERYLTENVRDALDSVRTKLESEDSLVKITVPYFIHTKSPISGLSQWLPIDVSVLGVCEKGDVSILMSVEVPYMSCCPCSKELAEGKGAHNQRSIAKVVLINPKDVLFEDVVSIVEQCASAPVRELLKRPDEKFVTVCSYEHPRFVEDMVRALSEKLTVDNRFEAFFVKVIHFESIHVHQASAITGSVPSDVWRFLSFVI